MVEAALEAASKEAAIPRRPLLTKRSRRDEPGVLQLKGSGKKSPPAKKTAVKSELVGLLAFVMAPASTPEPGAQPAADTAPVSLEGLGKLRGSVIDGVARFLNVPYAAPPVGPLRWRPPRPPAAWSGERANPKELSECPQPPSPEGGGKTFKGHVLRSTEDCLVLNVFAPADAIPATQLPGRVGRQLLPVLVYIHGGGGKLSSCHYPNFSGQELAKQERLCYVAINYRLGIFGFLAHPALSEEDEQDAGRPEDCVPGLAGSGNYAILDQLAALQWVQRHAGSFGGDPENVTIWGLSSGAQYVSALLASPPAAGLFHRAMVQSCVDLANLRKLRSGSDIWLGRSAEDWGVALGTAMGCERREGAEGMRQQLEAMRALSAGKLVQCSYAEEAMDCYEAAIDSRWGRGWGSSGGLRSVKPQSAAEAMLSEGNFHRVPVLMGYTEQDGLGKMELEHTMFQESNVSSAQGLQALLRREFGAAAEQVQRHYPHAAAPKAAAKRVRVALGDLSKDLWYEAATWCTADALAGAADAAPVFLYCFTQKLPILHGGRISMRSFHGVDLGFWSGLDGRAGELGCKMRRYLANFARRGDPNGEGLPQWAVHAAGCGRYMELGPGLGMQHRAAAQTERHELLEREYFRKRLREQAGEEEVPSEQGAAKRQRTLGRTSQL